MSRPIFPAMIAALLMLSGCSKSSPSPAPPASAPSVSSALSPAAVQEEAQRAAAANLPQPVWDTPDNAYVPITSGPQVMFLYAAFSGLPPDYDKMAQIVSNDYRMVTDTFKKQDLLTALAPKLDSQIIDAKSHPYITWTDNTPQLSHYDFNSRAFTDQGALLQVGGYVSFSDAGNYQLAVTNGTAFRQLHVLDEAKARQIETFIGQWQALQIKVFAYVQSTADSVSPTVKVVITKEQLIDAHGQVLLEQESPH